MKVEVEVPYPVSGLLPQHRTAARGVATFRKSFDLAEATDQDLPVAFSVSGLRSTLSRSRNREGHDVLSTVVCDGSPWMAIDFDGSAPIREPSLAGMLGNVVSRRIARFVELDQDLAPIDAARFRSVVHDGREECERIAREAVARLMLWRGKVWERNVVPLYAVHGGDRPDVSIVPSSSARYNFFDHFLPNDRDTALEKFASYGGRGSVAHIEAAAEFSFDLEMYRPLLVRAARDLVESLEGVLVIRNCRYEGGTAHVIARGGQVEFLTFIHLLDKGLQASYADFIASLCWVTNLVLQVTVNIGDIGDGDGGFVFLCYRLRAGESNGGNSSGGHKLADATELH